MWIKTELKLKIKTITSFHWNTFHALFTGSSKMSAATSSLQIITLIKVMKDASCKGCKDKSYRSNSETAEASTSPIRSASWRCRKWSFKRSEFHYVFLELFDVFYALQLKIPHPIILHSISHLACWFFLLIDAINHFTTAEVQIVLWIVW